MASPTLAVTGGTGFVGMHLLRIAAAQGYGLRALARRPQTAQPGVAWVAGALDRPDRLAELCAGADAVIHIAGVINARTRAGFEAGNVAGTQAVVDAARAAGVKRFIHVSSLAAREPALSIYGASKAGAEQIVEGSGLDWTMVRPPMVYGPGDRETLMLFRMVARGVAALPGNGRFSMIEVGDLARALIALAAAKNGIGAVFDIDDGRAGGYSHAEFARLIGDALDRAPRIIAIPPAGLMLGAAVDTFFARLSGRLPKLSFDRARYLAHPDWTADSTPLRALGLWSPQMGAREGLAAAAAWYKDHAWL